MKFATKLVLAGGMLVGALASTGCQPAPPSGRGAGKIQSPDKTTVSNVSQPVAFDDCGERMHEVVGALLVYYLNRHTLPERLEDLKTVPGIDPNLKLSCPANGKSFVYVRNGLTALGHPKRILVYDPIPSDPSPTGIRWCVLAPPFNSGQPTQTIEAYPMPTREFVSYLPIIEDR